MELKDVEPMLKEITKSIEEMRTALTLAGICPYCGEKVKPQDKENGKFWDCKCGRLKGWLSNKYIADKKGNLASHERLRKRACDCSLNRLKAHYGCWRLPVLKLRTS